ncbi:adrenodoxin-NADP+ reductase [Nematocida sp. AWRm80]|nr:adrenodoxin-NADP+ reductase [Nematocida sp. AWRm80]
MKVCIIGAGPASAYFLESALRNIKDLAADVFEKSTTTLGHLRNSVAPDQLGVRSTIPKLHKVFSDPRVSLHTQAEVGKNVSLGKIQNKYDCIVLAAGAGPANQLNIPGDKYALQAEKYLQRLNQGTQTNLGSRVAVIGNGNVALDAARMALKAKGVSLAEKVFVIGRGSPLDSKMTPPVLSELLSLPIQKQTSRKTLEWYAGVKRSLLDTLPRPERRKLQLLLEGTIPTEINPETRPKEKVSKQTIEFCFWEQPVSIVRENNQLTLETKDKNNQVHKRRVDSILLALGHAPLEKEPLLKKVKIPVYSIGWSLSKGNLSDGFNQANALVQRLINKER